MEKAHVNVSARRCVGRKTRGREKVQLEGAPLIAKCYINFKSPQEIHSL